jgi:hypothetical protein
MTGQEIHSYFKLELDKTNTSSVVSFEPDEVNYWVNCGALKYVNTRYTGNNPTGSSFEQTQKRIDDLHNLVKEYTFTYPNGGIAEKGGKYVVDLTHKIKVNNEDKYVIGDYLHSVGESVVIFDLDYYNGGTGLKCWQGTKTDITNAKKSNVPISSTPINTITKKILNYKQELTNSLSDYHYHNGTANPISVWSTYNTVDLYTDGNYGIYSYTLAYIRVPEKVDSKFYTDNIGTIHKEYNDFSDYSWREIIKMSVQLALENIGDTERAQMAMADTLTFE